MMEECEIDVFKSRAAQLDSSASSGECGGGGSDSVGPSVIGDDEEDVSAATMIYYVFNTTIISRLPQRKGENIGRLSWMRL